MKATIYHNPRCGTSRKTLEILEQSGADITIIDYLQTPPSPDALRRLYARAGISPREGLRAKESLAQDLDLVVDPGILAVGAAANYVREGGVARDAETFRF